ncbi:MAG: DUF3857 domain-containing protein [Deltaproteobacteria bacterium]|nr:DUF3857 domain-containing protein [Deltaproteobacteria bacterium]
MNRIGVIFSLLFSLFVPAYGHTHSKALSALQRQPDSRFADLLVLQIFDEYATSGRVVIEAELNAALSLKRLDWAARDRVLYLLAQLKMMSGDYNTANRMFAELGFITDWTIVGPFPHESGSGITDTLSINSEDSSTTPLNLQVAPNCVPSLSRGPCQFSTSWMSHSMGRISFEPLFSPSSNICTLAQTTVHVDNAGVHQLVFGAGGQSQVTVDTKIVLTDTSEYDADINRHALQIPLEKGAHTLTVKICSGESGRAGFYARLIAPEGRPLHSAKASPFEPVSMATPVNAPNKSPLKKMTPSEKSRLAHLGFFAQYAKHTGAVGKDTTVFDAARAACTSLKTVSFCKTFAELSGDINTKLQAWRNVLSATPENREAKLAILLLRARHQLDSDAAYALQELATAKDADINSRCALLEYFTMNLPQTAQHLRVAHMDDADILPGEIRCIADNLKGIPVDLHTAALLDMALRIDFTDYDYQIRRMNMHGRTLENELPKVAAAWKGLGAPPVHGVRALIELARGAGLNRLASDLAKDTRLYAPAVSLYRQDAGKAALFTDQSMGISLLKEALAQSPQNKSLRDYIAHIEPQRSFESAYIVPPSDFLNNKQKCISQKTDCYLVNNTMVRVHENGLASSVSQIVVAIASAEGTRQWQQYSEQFSSNQTIQVLGARIYRADGKVEQATGQATFPVSEPWYRLYYDIEAEVVELPSPEVGDVVEFQFRIDDIGSENMFGEYFGTIVPINAELPVESFQLVIMRPKSLPLQFESSKAVRRDEWIENETVTTVFSDKGIKAIPDEPAAPGAMSLVQYVHATTWTSWAKMEAWYRALIKPQLRHDAELKERVLALTHGAKSRQEKIAAIYNWVTTNIRYVGLEFGIHGYKPYSTTQVLTRGFGDCKDTASLIVTMLNEAGIDAHVALVRTRTAGELNTRFPSLALFNHAIAYVPEFDLWLDGTATFHGTTDMPFEDQGINALVIGLAPMLPRQTKTLRPEDATFVQHDVISPNPDGSAAIASTVTASGSPFAPWLRSTFASAQRQDILENHFSDMYSAVTIDHADFTEFSPLSPSPVITFQGNIPSLFILKRGIATFRAAPPLNLKQKFAPIAKRQHALQIGPARKATYTVRYLLPAGFVSTTEPSVASVHTKFGTYQREIQSETNCITVSRTFEINQPLVPASQYGEFVKFTRDVDVLEKAQISIKQQEITP